MEFRLDEPKDILGYMARLLGAGDGWINLTPKVSDEAETTSLNFLTLFGGGSTGVAMCTWLPEVRESRGRNHVRLGISHVTGLRARAQLYSLAIPIPTNWRVVQDHPRRGLVLEVPSEEPNELVLTWALAAVSALNRLDRAGIWRAEIYVPSSS